MSNSMFFLPCICIIICFIISAITYTYNKAKDRAVDKAINDDIQDGFVCLGDVYIDKYSNMSNLKEALAQDFIFLHGDKKYSKEHQFIACERSRNETHVIVGYAYRWFSDAKTTISQYAIPISDWEDTEKFITFNDYVKENLITGEKYNLHNINYCLSINAFFIEHLEDSMSTINERNHRKNPPYKCCDKEVDYSDDDFMEIYD